MIQNKGIGMSNLRRLVAVVLLGGLCLVGTAAPVGAQTLTGGGKIYAVADCNVATRTANVSVTVMNPSFATTGLVYYVELWAKARYETKYNFISGGQSSVINTWTRLSSSVLVNNPTTVFRGAFTGSVETYYDIYIKWWNRTPNSSTWAGPYGFAVATDPDSYITTTSNAGYGNLSLRTSDCFL